MKAYRMPAIRMLQSHPADPNSIFAEGNAATMRDQHSTSKAAYDLSRRLKPIHAQNLI